MTKYFFIENGNINGGGELKRSEEQIINFEVSDEMFNNYVMEPDRYIWQIDKVVENPEYEKLKRQAVIRDEIDSLTRTLEELDKKRVRAICENSIKDEETSQTWLDYYNEEVIKIRNNITELSEMLTL